MTQRYTEAEETQLRASNPAPDTELQMSSLRVLADRAQRAGTMLAVSQVRDEVLRFRASLGPDDDTYDVLVDPLVDEYGLNLLTYCNQRLAGHPDYARRFLPENK